MITEGRSACPTSMGALIQDIASLYSWGFSGAVVVKPDLLFSHSLYGMTTAVL